MINYKVNDAVLSAFKNIAYEVDSDHAAYLSSFSSITFLYKFHSNFLNRTWYKKTKN
jgi:hypothetical protein